jgi:hypothetical protein
MNCGNKLSLTLVSAVDVARNGTGEDLLTEIGLLSDLVDLQLHFKQSAGSVPSQLGTLSSLE